MSEQQVCDRPHRVIEPTGQAHPLHVAAVFDQQADHIAAVHHHGERQSRRAGMPGHLGRATADQLGSSVRLLFDIFNFFNSDVCSSSVRGARHK